MKDETMKPKFEHRYFFLIPRTDHPHLLHLLDELDVDPVEDFSDAGDVSAFALDDQSVGEKDASVVKSDGSESVSGDHELVPAEPDQLDLELTKNFKPVGQNSTWLAQLLPDPAALGSIPTVPQIFLRNNCQCY